MIKESKQARQERQLKQWKSLMREMRKGAMEMWSRKIKKDAYYQNNDNTFTVSEIY